MLTVPRQALAIIHLDFGSEYMHLIYTHAVYCTEMSNLPSITYRCPPPLEWYIDGVLYYKSFTVNKREQVLAWGKTSTAPKMASVIGTTHPFKPLR